jgi:uncharacterized membrane protein
MPYAAAYLAAAIAFLVLDLVWLGWIAGGFYRSALGGLLLETPNIPAAVAFYALYLAGVLVFAVRPAFAAKSLRKAVVSGALFGFFAYATYDLTNLATLKGWSLAVSVVDILWGTVLTALTATVGYIAARRAAGKPSA